MMASEEPQTMCDIYENCNGIADEDEEIAKEMLKNSIDEIVSEITDKDKDESSNNAAACPAIDIPDQACLMADMKSAGLENSASDSLCSASPDECYRYEDQENGCCDTDSDDGICHLRRSRSDELLTIKHHLKSRRFDNQEYYPACISENVDGQYSSRDDVDVTSDPDLGGATYRQNSQSGADMDNRGEDRVNKEKIVFIEDEYIHRISSLEERQSELEDVLAKLNSAMEALCLSPAPASPCIKTEGSTEAGAGKSEDINQGAGTDEDTGETTECSEDLHKQFFTSDADGKAYARAMGLQLYSEFQQKIRNFATDLNAVLNCSEAAIRHARIIQEWATEVQRIFDHLKEDRHKLQMYITERERNLALIREQFSNELEQQDFKIRQLVAELRQNETLNKRAEKYAEKKAGTEMKQAYPDSHTEKNIIDFLLRRRTEEDKSMVIHMAKQSKISELKLFIVHQQTCIQQLQEQNRELRAIIEGLMGPDDTESDLSSTDPTGTPTIPGEDGTPCPVRETLDKMVDSTATQLSDVVYCDRGVYFPGHSTDGDIATIQTFDIGDKIIVADAGKEDVFDPLAVDYVRDQCRKAEDSYHETTQEMTSQQFESAESTDDALPEPEPNQFDSADTDDSDDNATTEKLTNQGQGEPYSTNQFSDDESEYHEVNDSPAHDVQHGGDGKIDFGTCVDSGVTSSEQFEDCQTVLTEEINVSPSNCMGKSAPTLPVV